MLEFICSLLSPLKKIIRYFLENINNNIWKYMLDVTLKFKSKIDIYKRHEVKEKYGSKWSFYRKGEITNFSKYNRGWKNDNIPADVNVEKHKNRYCKIKKKVSIFEKCSPIFDCKTSQRGFIL